MLSMFPVDAFQQHRQLGRRQMDFFVFRPGQTKRPPSRRLAFGEQVQTIGVDPQYLNHVATVPPEDEGLPRERIVPERILNQWGQPIEAVAQVGDVGHASRCGCPPAATSSALSFQLVDQHAQ